MTTIGIVGAGAAASAATFAIDRADADVDVTILEKSRGVCGRAATRRRDGVTYDYGANYVQSDDEQVVELLTETLRADGDGLVEITDPIWTFDRNGVVTPGRDGDGHRWSYRAGLTQIAKRLLERTDATVRHGTRIEGITRDGDAWRVTDADGTEWGPFDVLVLNPPAPQTATLLSNADWDHPTRNRLREAAAAIPYRPVWTAILGYPFALEAPYYALINSDRDHAIGWIAREECKPGHVPDGESVLVVQASPEWSRTRYDEPPADNVATLATLTADLLEDDRLTEPAWSDHQGWRYALPDAGVDLEAIHAAERKRLYCVGDWVAGEGRVHAALRNGLETGRRIVDAST